MVAYDGLTFSTVRAAGHMVTSISNLPASLAPSLQLTQAGRTAAVVVGFYLNSSCRAQVPYTQAARAAHLFSHWIHRQRL